MDYEINVLRNDIELYQSEIESLEFCYKVSFNEKTKLVFENKINEIKAKQLEAIRNLNELEVFF